MKSNTTFIGTEGPPRKERRKVIHSFFNLRNTVCLAKGLEGTLHVGVHAYFEPDGNQKQQIRKGDISNLGRI